ncbi:FMN-binding negative transcriptional regulator [Pseudogulbenkiania sp. MAI-1]|uniref:FMN-binding negative transcriptional regulator n=1 Tax=Pseudogulbenkiania sp. MAI-1 TaxID=990370 RepID=UPI00045EB34C|nr:FMN-binding negative transcriptional regulator [Pseudogulbenkiania sp. MAI-1]
MYVPKHFEAPSVEAMHELMRTAPLATLVSSTSVGLEANHIPLLWSPDPAAPSGCLRGHVARANPLWRNVTGESEVLAIFHGPDAYVSPGWYPSKQEDGKVVPTWNYVAVHAHGRLRTIDDRDWLREQLTLLTAEHEAGMASPWQLTDAPAGYIDKLMGAVVGIEIVISRLEGKWKASQNQPVANRDGVAAGLAVSGRAGAARMAALVAAGAEHRT